MTDTRAPRFSIIVPAFNAATTIERALTAILAQDVSDWELIVVDDHSTDHTADLVLALAASHPARNIQVIRHPENRGVAASRNSGIVRARGQYIAFVDSDDECLPHYLSTFLAAFDPTVDAVLVGREVISTNGAVTVWASTALGTFTGSSAVRLAMLDKLTPFPWDKAFRRSLFLDIRFPEGLARFEDMMTNILIYSRARFVRSIPTPGYRYFIASDSLTWGRIPAIEEATSAADYLKAHLPVTLVSGNYRRPFAAMRSLMTILVAQTAIARGNGNIEADSVIAASRRGISCGDSWSTLFVSPRIGMAILLLKIMPKTYANLYKRHVRREYGIDTSAEGGAGTVTATSQ
jgi:hypothetical protein